MLAAVNLLQELDLEVWFKETLRIMPRANQIRWDTGQCPAQNWAVDKSGLLLSQPCGDWVHGLTMRFFHTLMHALLVSGRAFQQQTAPHMKANAGCEASEYTGWAYKRLETHDSKTRPYQAGLKPVLNPIALHVPALSKRMQDSAQLEQSSLFWKKRSSRTEQSIHVIGH